MSWSFLGFGLILSTSPIHYVKLVNNAAITVGPIILQYPFYAGIMGIMADTGLINILADKISEISPLKRLVFTLLYQVDWLICLYHQVEDSGCSRSSND